MTRKEIEKVLGDHVPAWLFLILLLVIVAPGTVPRIIDAFVPPAVETNVDEVLRKQEILLDKLGQVDRRIQTISDRLGFQEQRLSTLEAWRRFMADSRMPTDIGP